MAIEIMLEPRQNLEKKDTPSILKDHFFQGHTHFHFNSTSVVRMVRRNQLSFSSLEINKERRVGQIQVQKLAVLVTINQMPDNIKISIESNITNFIIQKVNNELQKKCRTKNNA